MYFHYEVYIHPTHHAPLIILLYPTPHRGDDFLGTITRQKMKLRAECTDLISEPSREALERAQKGSEVNPVQEAHEILDFVLTAAICISECTNEVNSTRSTVLENVAADETAAIKVLEQLLQREEAQSQRPAECLPSLPAAEGHIEAAVQVFSLPTDHDYGESSDAGGESQLCLLTGPAVLSISR